MENKNNKKIVGYSKNEIYIDTEITEEFIKLMKQKERIEKKLSPLEKQLKEQLMPTMEKLGKTTFSYKGITGKLKSGYTKTSLDTNKLKKENFKIYSKYLKTSQVSGSLSLTID